MFSVNLNCTPEALRDWRRVEFDIVISIAFRENTTELKLRRAKLCSYGNHTSLSPSARVEIIRKTVSRGVSLLFSAFLVYLVFVSSEFFDFFSLVTNFRFSPISFAFLHRFFLQKFSHCVFYNKNVNVNVISKNITFSFF